MYCTKCGNELKSGDKFCVKCGTATNMNQINYQTINNNTSDNSISETALAGFICSIVGLFIYGIVLRSSRFNTRFNFQSTRRYKYKK